MAPNLPPKDLDILRRLFGRKMEIAHSETNLARRRDWLRHDNGPNYRPMILAESGGIRDTVKPVDISPVCECESDYARGIEWGLRSEISRFEHLKDDHVVAPWASVNWRVHRSNFGVEPKQHHTENNGHLAARNWEPAIADLDRDFHLLKPRTMRVDREATLREREVLAKVFDGLGPVELRGGHFWTAGLTITAIDLIGLEQLMLAMYDNPAGLHRVMAFLRDDMLAFTEWLEREGLLNLDSHND
jgi:hypothetical protein